MSAVGAGITYKTWKQTSFFNGNHIPCCGTGNSISVGAYSWSTIYTWNGFLESSLLSCVEGRLEAFLQVIHIPGRLFCNFECGALERCLLVENIPPMKGVLVRSRGQSRSAGDDQGRRYHHSMPHIATMSLQKQTLLTLGPEAFETNLLCSLKAGNGDGLDGSNCGSAICWNVCGGALKEGRATDLTW